MPHTLVAVVVGLAPTAALIQSANAPDRQRMPLGLLTIQPTFSVSDWAVAGKVLDDFGTLSAALETAAAVRSKVAAQQAASSQKPSSRVSQKRRQRIAALETGQLSAVLAHPAFQSDPFAAIQEHLKNTVVEPKG